MARFGQGFIQSLTQPSYMQGLFDLGKAAGSLPGRAREERNKNDAMAAATSAFSSESPSEILQAAQAVQEFDPALAEQLRNRALTLRQQRADLQPVTAPKPRDFSIEQKQMDNAVAKRKRLEQNVMGVIQRSNRGEEDKRRLMEGYLGASTEDLIKFLRTGGQSTMDFGTGITEWVDASGNTVLKTVQSPESPFPFELGSGRAVRENELAGLTKKAASPGVSVSLGDKGATKYEEGISKALAEQDAKDIERGELAADNLATINEARLVLEENPDVLGLGSENIDTLKKGFIRVLSGLGVTDKDPVYKKITEQSSSVDLYRSFTQDFVVKRMEATKGAISDIEYSSFIASVPNLMETEEGYRSLLNLMERASTAAVLRSEHLRNAAMSERSSKQSVYEARQEWNNFRRDFPLGMLPSKAMTEVWGDYNKPDFNRDNMVFSVIGLDGTPELTTYKDIVEAGRNSRDNLTAHSSIKRAFEKFGAVYVPLM